MPLTQINVWACEVCHTKIEVITRHIAQPFETETVNPASELSFGWGLLDNMLEENLACPACMENHTPIKKRI